MYYGRLLNKNVFFIMAFPCTQNTTSCSIILVFYMYNKKIK